MDQNAEKIVNIENADRVESRCVTDIVGNTFHSEIVNNIFCKGAAFHADYDPPKYAYKTSRISSKAATEMLCKSTCPDFRKAISDNNVLTDVDYFLDSEYILESFYEDGLRFVKVNTRINGLSISGKTSRDKWASKSQLHNYIDAGRCHLKTIFRVISKDTNPLIVQYQVIGD